MKSVLVTGCSSGIGRYAAYALRERGYRVVASARAAADLAALRDDGFDALELDLADGASVAAAADAALTLSGGAPYALFNNAGFGLYGAVEDIGRDALRAQFEVNLFGTHELTVRLLPALRRSRGRIVFNSSVLGVVALPYRGAYSASKFALEALADTLRLELRGSGVAVSLIEPGPIESRFGVNAERALRRHIDIDSGPHAAVYTQLLPRLRGETDGRAGRFRLGPDAVYEKLLHALESPRPRPRYRVTKPAHLMSALRRALPTRALDRLLARQL